ncbi:helicase-associated domain-containing protein [Antribacter gilvus]|uniref:helicase-associated domain-containing protein n=1 Tax=Antribacter gilvus TaxID=2304675 RepID=UPI000F7B3F51|nr:helicase-associated domain-containing protein [Antribacter gilvus]
MASTLRDPAPSAPTRHFADALRERPDGALVALLRARPDLGSPSPSTLRSLAARASSRTSLERALARSDALTLQILEAVLALAPPVREPGTPPAPPGTRATGGSPARPRVTPAAVAEALGADPEERQLVEECIARALEAALLWDAIPSAAGPSPQGRSAARRTGVAAGPDLRPAPGLDEVLGPYPAGLGPDVDPPTTPRPLPGPDAPAGARAVLDALAWGPPVGVVPPPGSRPRDAVDWLVRNGYLVRSDARHVLLPRAVGLALRGGRTHQRLQAQAPRPEGRPVSAATVDAEAAGAALDIVRRVGVLVSAWDDAPAPQLRTGGLGVRDLRRVATAMETDEASAAFVVELAALAGLVVDDGDAPPTYVPTDAAEPWSTLDDADRWAVLARAWALTRRTPWQIGTRDERGTLRAPLSPDLQRPWVPRLRAQVLEVLQHGSSSSGERPALSTAEVLEVLTWRTPRAVPPERAVDGLLMEASWLGVTGAGALSAPGRALLETVVQEQEAPSADGGRVVPVVDRVAAAVRVILPHEVDEILLQGDLTGIVPGRPSRDLARLLEQTSETESRGAATTVRFTAATITRALDHGADADSLLTELARRSPVPLPQPLDYLVRDTARRHGAVRVGSAGSYLRAADPVVLAGLEHDPSLSSLGLVRLAPTVLAAAADAGELHEALRARGMVSAVEGPNGQVVDVRRVTRPRRAVPARRSALALASGRTTAEAVSTEPDYAALVSTLRAVDASAGDAAQSRAAAREAARNATSTVLRSADPAARPAPAAPISTPRPAALPILTSPTLTPPAAGSPAPAGEPPAAGPDAPQPDEPVQPAEPVERGFGHHRAVESAPEAGGAPGRATGVGHRDGDDASAPDVTTAAPAGGTQHPADALALLRDAIRDGRKVQVDLVGRSGTLERRELRPLRLDGGRLRAVDPLREAELTIAVHRIAAVEA